MYTKAEQTQRQLRWPRNIHPELLRDTNRSETASRWLPVGTNQ